MKKAPTPIDDDYYALQKKRIAEETQQAHKIHEKEIESHLNSVIPYFEEANGEDSRLLVLLNNILVHRFKEVGLIYWNIFRHTPTEIREYADLFGNDFDSSSVERVIIFLEEKKKDAANLVDIGFDDQELSNGLLIGEYGDEEGNIFSLN